MTPYSLLKSIAVPPKRQYKSSSLHGVITHMTVFFMAAAFMTLTNYMEHRPFSEANRFSASQEIPRILWNPKVHYRIHNSPPPVPVRSHINPVHVPHPTSGRSLLILYPHLRWVFYWSLFLRFHHQEASHGVLLPSYLMSTEGKDKSVWAWSWEPYPLPTSRISMAQRLIN